MTRLLSFILVLALGGGIFFAWNKSVPSKVGENLSQTSPILLESKLETANVSTLSMAVTPKAICDLGDLEAIQMDVSLSGTSPRFLLSLEELAAYPMTPTQVLEVTLDDLKRGFAHDFKLPEKPVQLGLFLCKDSGLQGRCFGKEARDLSAVIVENLRGSKDRKFQAPDRIYLFQPILATGKDIRWLPQSASSHYRQEGAWNGLKRTIASEFPGFDHQPIDVMKALYDRLGSPSFSFQAPRFNLDVTYTTSQGCGE